jgi:hypothetical protein
MKVNALPKKIPLNLLCKGNFACRPSYFYDGENISINGLLKDYYSDYPNFNCLAENYQWFPGVEYSRILINYKIGKAISPYNYLDLVLFGVGKLKITI